ncbi:Transposable element Tc3 transposase [Porphyridium purpureum]|uniref:Transposable element Tc3 transposase n=1 Tax=Porphyridium purpureum TaxID=35688 RepID=A0A5J4Z4Q1_PORPP|nr:Transposable element Tc3 transposase [Porphyridium purpureum]|eukprot:POR0908..scf295_1
MYQEFAFRRMPKNLPLTVESKRKRLDWARAHMAFGEKWKKAVFTDEKKFNLDGPDGFHATWMGKTKVPVACWSRYSGGGSLMVWGAISSRGKLCLHFVEGTVTAVKYVHMLQEKELFPKCRAVPGNDFIWMHDNAKPHTANLTANFFRAMNVNVMEWPVYSPDFNIVENVWGILARKVFEDGRQYTTVNGLKSAVLAAWYTIEQATIDNLYLSVEDRLWECARRNGEYMYGNPSQFRFRLAS